MPRMRHTIRNMPLRGSLTTAGQQGSIPEAQLWQAKNCSAGLDGLMTKRPGLWQWGQTIKQPARTDVMSFYDMFIDLGSWTNDGGSDGVLLGVHNGRMRATVTNNDSSGTSNPSTEIIGRVPGA